MEGLGLGLGLGLVGLVGLGLGLLRLIKGVRVRAWVRVRAVEVNKEG